MCVLLLLFFYIVKAPRPGAFSQALPNRLICIAMHSACSKHWIKVLSKNAQFDF